MPTRFLCSDSTQARDHGEEEEEDASTEDASMSQCKGRDSINTHEMHRPNTLNICTTDMNMNRYILPKKVSETQHAIDHNNLRIIFSHNILLT